MKSWFWVGLILLILGGASFFIALPTTGLDGASTSTGSVWVSSHGDRVLPMTGRIALLVVGLGLLATGRK